MRDIENYQREYIRPGFEDFEVFFRQKKMLSIMSQYHTGRILEIGCGMDPLFKYLDPESYDSYTVIEPAEKFYDNAVQQSSVKKYRHKVHCIKGSFGAGGGWRRQLGELDFIMCSSLLHEVEHPKEFLEALSDICSYDTILHINVPNANSFHRVLALEMGLINDTHDLTERNLLFQQYHVFDMDSLVGILLETGFEIVDSGSYFIKPFTHSQMYQMIENEIINENVLEGLYKICSRIPELGAEIFVNVRIKKSLPYEI